MLLKLLTLLSPSLIIPSLIIRNLEAENPRTSPSTTTYAVLGNKRRPALSRDIISKPLDFQISALPNILERR